MKRWRSFCIRGSFQLIGCLFGTLVGNLYSFAKLPLIVFHTGPTRSLIGLKLGYIFVFTIPQGLGFLGVGSGLIFWLNCCQSLSAGTVSCFPEDVTGSSGGDCPGGITGSAGCSWGYVYCPWVVRIPCCSYQ